MKDFFELYEKDIRYVTRFITDRYNLRKHKQHLPTVLGRGNNQHQTLFDYEAVIH